MKRRIFIFCVSLLLPLHKTHASQKAVICVPVADLLGQPIATIFPDTSAEQSYNSIGMCGTQITSPLSCPRLHQLLYNDIVDVVKETDDEVCIQISHAYYLTTSSTIPQNQYWTLKKNICYLNRISTFPIPITSLPNPIDFSDTNHGALYNTETVTLTEPHYYSKLKITFSAGTRFARTTTPLKKRASNIDVFIIDYISMKQQIIKIPLTKCMFNRDNQTKEQRITEFVYLLKKWAHCKKGHIPYVWGGTSFRQPVHGNFKEITKTSCKGDYSFYEYEKNIQQPKSGFDCSGLILRAAQICGIPYFCKNTATIAQCLPPLSINDKLNAGDLILIKGHVMIVSDIAKNLLIEARSYGHGYGKLHEIPLNQVFDNIETYNDLWNAYKEKKVIKRKDKDGKIRDSFTNLQLFSMKNEANKKDPL